jgi:hypothetical protein
VVGERAIQRELLLGSGSSETEEREAKASIALTGNYAAFGLGNSGQKNNGALRLEWW